MVVLSTHTERTQIVVSSRNTHSHESGNGKRHRHGSVKSASPEAKRA